MKENEPFAGGQTFRAIDCAEAAGLTRGQLQYFKRKLSKGIAECPTEVRTTLGDGVTSNGPGGAQRVHREHAALIEILETETIRWDRCSFEQLALFCGCVALHHACAPYVEDGWIAHLFREGVGNPLGARASLDFYAYVRRLFSGREPFLILEERAPAQVSAVPYYCILGEDPNIAAGSFANLGIAGGETLHFIPFRTFVEPAVARLREKYPRLPQVPKRNVARDRHKVELTEAEYELISLIRRNNHLQGQGGAAAIQVHVAGGGAISKLAYRERHTYQARNVPKFEADSCVQSIVKSRDKTGGFGNIILEKEKTFG